MIQIIFQLIHDIKPDDTSYILFTSGSTAFPKPVLRSHGSNIGIAHYISPDLREEDIYLHYLSYSRLCIRRFRKCFKRSLHRTYGII